MSSFYYTFGWLLLVWLGAHHESMWGLVAGTALVALFLGFQRIYNRKLYIRDLVVFIGSLALGFVFEAILLTSGVLSYATENSLSANFPPAWILFLYPLFGFTMNNTLQFLLNDWRIAALFGFIGGPLSYYAGERMGGVILHSSYSLVVLAFGWALYMLVIRAFALRCFVVIDRLLIKRK